MSHYSITYNAIRFMKCSEVQNTFGGSSSFTAQIASEPHRKPKKDKPQNTGKVISGTRIQAYSLNAPKIRKKIDAFFQLEATREFCAWYTITFPPGFEDYDAYTCFNIWQTRCRKEHNLKSFLWVSERQQNGTIHFHLLTNTRMPIKEVNGYMKTSLIKYWHKYNWTYTKENWYNGIDVDNVWYSKRRKNLGQFQKRTRDEAARVMSKYMSKYVTKNKGEYTRQPWRCSHDISALFTCQNFDLDECNTLLSYFHATREKWRKIEAEACDIYIYPGFANFNKYIELRAVNEIVMKMIHDTT